MLKTRSSSIPSHLKGAETATALECFKHVISIFEAIGGIESLSMNTLKLKKITDVEMMVNIVCDSVIKIIELYQQDEKEKTSELKETISTVDEVKKNKEFIVAPLGESREKKVQLSLNIFDSLLKKILPYSEDHQLMVCRKLLQFAFKSFSKISFNENIYQNNTKMEEKSGDVETKTAIEWGRRLYTLTSSLTIRGKSDMVEFNDISNQALLIMGNSYFHLMQFEEVKKCMTCGSLNETFEYWYLALRLAIHFHRTEDANIAIKTMISHPKRNHNLLLNACGLYTEALYFTENSLEVYRLCSEAFPSEGIDTRIEMIRNYLAFYATSISTSLNTENSVGNLVDKSLEYIKQNLNEMIQQYSTELLILSRTQVTKMQDCLHDLCIDLHKTGHYKICIEFGKLLLPLCLKYPTRLAAANRVIGLSYAKAGMLSKATFYANQASENDPGCASYFTGFQIALIAENQGGDAEITKSQFQLMCKAPDFELSHLCSVASMSLEFSNFSIARYA